MPTQNPLYKCNNIDGECSNAINKTTFPLRQGEDLKCPVCGKKDIEAVLEPKVIAGGKASLGRILLGAAIVLLLIFGIYKLLPISHHEPVIPAERPYLVLAGSNTIGETLGPALVQGWLESMHATDIQTVPKMFNEKEIHDEKQIEAVLNGKKIIVEIRAHGSKTGFRDLLNDSADIGMSSEPVNDSIYQKFQSRKPNENMRFVTNENIIGHDGIAVIVNANNPLTELTIENVKQMFIDGGSITDWSRVPGSGKSGPINLYRRDDNSGTTSMFKTMVLGGGNKAFASSATAIEKSEDLVTKVSNDPSGIGFMSYTFTKNVYGIKSLALKAGEGIQALIPLPVTIKNENYSPLQATFFILSEWRHQFRGKALYSICTEE